MPDNPTTASPVTVPSSDGVELALHDLGGEGPQLLIAHATGFCAGVYRPMVPVLGTRFHVWALDFRGHGASTLPDAGGALSWTGMADDVLAVVDHLGGAPVHGIGHSMGGACLMAAERRRPGTIRAALLFEPIIIPDHWEKTPGENPLAASARRRRPSFPSRLEALGRYASRPPLSAFRADVLAAYVEHGFVDAPDGSVTLACAPETEAQTFEATGKPTITQMHDVPVPTLVAYGTHDPFPGPGDFAPLVAAALPNGTERAYPHLGHFGPLQDPDTIADDALEFLTAHP